MLEAIVKKIPAPHGKEEEPLKSLIFDSYYDNFKGAVSLVRVFDGEVKQNSKIKRVRSI